MKMQPFSRLTAIAAPFPEAQINTDVIFPARFLLLLDRAGLGRYLFHERRAKGEFILDTPPWDNAGILVTGADFGSGSSREQAVWALADFGIRCLIGPSFGEIFHTNCIRNGLLPITLDGANLDQVMQAAHEARPLTVDLPAELIHLANDSAISFRIDGDRKSALLEGLDDIGRILRDNVADIEAFEALHALRSPWLRLDAGQLSYFCDTAEESDD